MRPGRAGRIPAGHSRADQPAAEYRRNRLSIINQTLLAQLPDESYVLNLARGVHVVEEDLLAALNSGKLKGAMLDVFSREPLPQESPLWAHPRVAMTPMWRQ